ncbi:MAG: S49 family peptidase, partial [Candidatus Micrarchaeota archaeon]
YVASGTDFIVSDPDAITGSIGVISTFTDMQGLFEKVGINVTAIKSGPHKDIGSPYRNMSDEEFAIMQGIVDEVYGEFRGVVLENRGKKLNMNVFSNVTDGRILSGRQAFKAGLVDELGGKKDAIRKAADMANITYNDVSEIRICPIQTSTADSGLFSMSGFIRQLQAVSNSPSLSFK